MHNKKSRMGSQSKISGRKTDKRVKGDTDIKSSYQIKARNQGNGGIKKMENMEK